MTVGTTSFPMRMPMGMFMEKDKTNYIHAKAQY